MLEDFFVEWLIDDVKHHIDLQQFGSLKGTSATYCLLDMLHNWLSSLDCPGKFLRVCFHYQFKRIETPTCVLKCGTISKITRMTSCTVISLLCDPNATLTILGTVAVLAASSIEQNASVLVFSQQWRKLTNLTSLVISSIVLYLYLNCK